MRYILCVVASLGLLWDPAGEAYGRVNYFPDDSVLVRTGIADGIGPFAGVSVNDVPVGQAKVWDGAEPDLFIATNKFSNFPSRSLFICRYVGRKEGVPVFEDAKLVAVPDGWSTKCVIFEEGGDVFGVWRDKKTFKVGRYERDSRRFVPASSKGIKAPLNRIWALHGGTDMSRVEFTGHKPGFVRGTRFANIEFYSVGAGFKPVDKRYAVGTDGVMLRGNMTSTNVIAYPSVDGPSCDLIFFGEGGRYYYRFAGRFDDRDQPVYHEQQNLLHKNAALYHHSLPVINTVDWDGDGDTDVIAGDSAGFISFLENIGSDAEPRILPGVKLESAGVTIRIRPGYYGSLQGPREANWGYTAPSVADWNEDGLPDIITSSSDSTHKAFFNTGTRRVPRVGPARPLFCDGLDLHGAWRVKPGVGKLNGKMAYILLDEEQEFHLYWKYDAQNLTDGGKLRLKNGQVISGDVARINDGDGGRVKITLFDWDRDGCNDMLVTTHSGNSIPCHLGGIPSEAGAMVLLMRNVTEGEDIRFEGPRPLEYKGRTLYLGEHSCTAAPWPFGDEYGMLVAIETGRFWLLEPKDISWGKPHTCVDSMPQRRSDEAEQVVLGQNLSQNLFLSFNPSPPKPMTPARLESNFLSVAPGDSVLALRLKGDASIEVNGTKVGSYETGRWMDLRLQLDDESAVVYIDGSGQTVPLEVPSPFAGACRVSYRTGEPWTRGDTIQGQRIEAESGHWEVHGEPRADAGRRAAPSEYFIGALQTSSRDPNQKEKHQ